MFDLKAIAAAYIDQVIEQEKTALLDHNWSDQVTYYEPTIVSIFCETHSINSGDLDLESLTYELAINQDQYLTTENASGFYSPSRGFVSLGSSEEIERENSELPFKVTPNRIAVINRYTDLYVADDRPYHYIQSGFAVCLDLKLVDLDNVKVCSPFGNGSIEISAPISAIKEIAQQGDNSAAVDRWLHDFDFSYYSQELKRRVFPGDDDPEFEKLLRDELAEFGAWDDSELSDYDENIKRAIWIASHDVSDRG